jgi:long-chain fatty acid transport protein
VTRTPTARLRLLVTVCLVIICFATGKVYAQGIALGGCGPVNRAMGGAATAAPIDAAGALLWNPASISGLTCSEMMIGLELLLPTEEVSSSVGPFAGSTRGEPGIAPIPCMALVHKCEGSPWTFGLGMFGIAGFNVNYPASNLLAPGGNPVLSPNPPAGLGCGRVYSEAQYLQIIPTASYAMTDQLSIGVGPTLTLAKLVVDPDPLATPNPALLPPNGSVYPPGSGTRYSWGGGFQVGVYYIADNAWHLGFTFKSPQWFEPTRVQTTDAAGNPREESATFDYPMILSLGLAYSGIEDWLFACDVRYFDYERAQGFGDPAAYDATGKVTGLGWKSVMSVHTGVQYHATERLYLRGGYQWNDNPIASEDTFFNVAAPLIVGHIVSAGFSYHLTCNLILSAAYLHGFENTSTGPFVVPTGPVPGYSVTSKISADALGLGLTLRY